MGILKKVKKLGAAFNPIKDTDFTRARVEAFGSDRDLRVGDLTPHGIKRLATAYAGAMKRTQIYPGTPTYGQAGTDVKLAVTKPSLQHTANLAGTAAVVAFPAAGKSRAALNIARAAMATSTGLNIEEAGRNVATGKSTTKEAGLQVAGSLAPYVLPSAIGVAGRRFRGIRAPALSSESGALRLGPPKKTVPAAAEAASPAAKMQAAKAITGAATRTERAAGQITGERVAAAGLADEAADLTRAAQLQKVPDEVLSQMRTPGAKQEKLRRLNARSGAAGGRTKPATTSEAISQAGIEPARAPRARGAGRTSEANRPAAARGGLKAATPAMTAPTLAESARFTSARTASEVAQHSATSVFQKMPDVALGRMAEQGVAGAKTEVAARAAAKAIPKPALGGTNTIPVKPTVNVAKPAAAETVSVAAPKAGGGLGMPSKSAAQSVAAEVKATAPKSKATPRGSNPAYTRKPGKTTTKPLAEEVPAVAPKPKGGSRKGQPRGAAIRREPQPGFDEALNAAGAPRTGIPTAPPVSAADGAAFDARMKAAEAGRGPKPKTGGLGKPRASMARPSAAEERAWAAAAAAPKPAATVPPTSPPSGGSIGRGPKPKKTPLPGRGIGTPGVGASSGGVMPVHGPPLPPGFAPPATPAAAVAQTGVKGVLARTTKSAVKRTKQAVVAGSVMTVGGVVATMGIDKLRPSGKPTAEDLSGVGGAETPSTAQTIDEAIAGMTDSETKTSMVALRAVQKKGEAEGYDALAALRSGLSAAQSDKEFPTQEELQFPHVSDRYAAEYKSLIKPQAHDAAGRAIGKPAISSEEAQGVLLEKAGKRRDEVLRANVRRAVVTAKQRAKNEALRKKNR